MNPKKLKQIKDQDIEAGIRQGLMEEEKKCEKCGGETAIKLVGDESCRYCEDCDWITY